MRITNTTIVADMLANLARSRERINQLNVQLATQKRIQKVSDDPAAAGAVLRLNADLARVESYVRNVVNGENTLKMTSDSLGKVSDILKDVKGLLAGVTTLDTSFCMALADSMDQYVDMAVDVANTRFGGKYIFGGTSTMAPPFVRSGVPETVAYRGNAGSIRFQVGDGISSAVNVSGAAAFASTGKIVFSGILDAAAPVNTIVSNMVSITDGNGITHNVEMVMRKTGANSWSLNAVMPGGATDATVSGGAASVTFDPATGAVESIMRGAPLIFTPTVTPPTQAAPAITLMVDCAGLSEGTPPGGASTFSGAHTEVSVFNALMAVRDALRSGTPPSADDLAMIGVMQNVIMREQARAGTLHDSLETADACLTSQKQLLLDLLEARQGVDLAEIGLKLKQEEITLEATLSAAAKIIPKSLLDFLG